jgi:hypothetical protein
VITRVLLVDPASGAGHGVVDACIKIGTLRYTLASLSAESPCAELLDPFVVDQDCPEFTLYVPGSCGEFAIQVEGYRQENDEAALSSEDDDGEDEYSSEEEDEAEALSSENDQYGLISEDDDDSDDDDDEDGCSSEEADEVEVGAMGLEEDDDSDSEDDDYITEDERSDGDFDVVAAMERRARALVDVLVVTLKPRDSILCRKFVGGLAPRFASAGSTAGFMQVAAMESQEEGEHTNKLMKIRVFYRCSHFFAGSKGGVRVRDSRVCCTLRFAVPRVCDTASSLQWVGSSLAPLVYPRRFHQRLQRLWSRLIAETSLPTRTSCVDVSVDFGILRTADRTQAHEAHERRA